MENIDISQFQTVSTLDAGDALLLARTAASGGAGHGKIKTPLFMSLVRRTLSPTISDDGRWLIGGEDTGVPATGADGKTPVLETGTVQTGSPGSEAQASVAYSRTDDDGNPVYLVSFTIPQGLPGEGAGNLLVLNPDELQPHTSYLFQTSSVGNPTGMLVPYTPTEAGTDCYWLPEGILNLDEDSTADEIGVLLSNTVIQELRQAIIDGRTVAVKSPGVTVRYYPVAAQAMVLGNMAQCSLSFLDPLLNRLVIIRKEIESSFNAVQMHYFHKTYTLPMGLYTLTGDLVDSQKVYDALTGTQNATYAAAKSVLDDIETAVKAGSTFLFKESKGTDVAITPMSVSLMTDSASGMRIFTFGGMGYGLFGGVMGALVLVDMGSVVNGQIVQ